MCYVLDLLKQNPLYKSGWFSKGKAKAARIAKGTKGDHREMVSLLKKSI